MSRMGQLGTRASPLTILAQRSSEKQTFRRNAAIAVSAVLAASEVIDRIPTRVYLRLRHERLGWQKSEQVVRSEALLHNGDTHAAEQPWRKTVAVVAAALGDSDWETMEAKIELAGLLLLQGTTDKVAEAERLLRPPEGSSQGRLRRSDSFTSQQETRMRHRLSRSRVSVLMAQQQFDDAEQLASGCVEDGVASFGEFDEDTVRAKAALREAAALRSRVDASLQRRDEAEQQQVAYA